MFPFRIGDRSTFYRRVLRIRPSSAARSGGEGRRVPAPISAEARRERILEEARIAVLERIRRTG